MGKRGRKLDTTTPTTKSREVQRAFRARRAAYMESLESKVKNLENEIKILREQLTRYNVPIPDVPALPLPVPQAPTQTADIHEAAMVINRWQYSQSNPNSPQDPSQDGRQAVSPQVSVTAGESGGIFTQDPNLQHQHKSQYLPEFSAETRGQSQHYTSSLDPALVQQAFDVVRPQGVNNARNIFSLPMKQEGVSMVGQNVNGRTGASIEEVSASIPVDPQSVDADF